MTNNRPSASDPVLAGLMELVPALETLYKDIHSHPELSMQETRTAGVAAGRLKAAGFEVTAGIGKTGVVGVQQHNTHVRGHSGFPRGIHGQAPAPVNSSTSSSTKSWD